MFSIYKVKTSSCACIECVAMCYRSPCLPTPAGAKNLIDAGHADKLEIADYYDTLLLSPKEVKNADRITSKCIFLDDKNKCTLHDAGLKPLEGKIAVHASNHTFKLREEIARTWRGNAGEKIIELFKTLTK